MAEEENVLRRALGAVWPVHARQERLAAAINGIRSHRAQWPEVGGLLADEEICEDDEQWMGHVATAGLLPRLYDVVDMREWKAALPPAIRVLERVGKQDRTTEWLYLMESGQAPRELLRVLAAPIWDELWPEGAEDVPRLPWPEPRCDLREWRSEWEKVDEQARRIFRVVGPAAVAEKDTRLAKTQKTPSEPPRYSLVRSAGGWTWAYEGRQIIARDWAGMRYIADLLRRPGVRVDCEDLESIRAERPAVSIADAKDLSSGDAADAPSYSGEKPQEIMDRPALAEAKRRLDSNREEQQKAKEEQNVPWLEELEDEERGILEELRGVIRPGGKSKAFQGEQEKRAARVRMAVTRMIESIAKTKGGEELAEHLKASIDYGAAVLYFGKLPWEVTLD
jgi:hypothetical protein